MKILRFLGFTIIILGMLLGSSAVAQTFSVADVSGEYTYASQGSITSIVDQATMQMQTIPIAAMGQFVADGNGGGDISAVMNIGGFVIINFEESDNSELTYTVDEPTTGMGTASAQVTATSVEFPMGPEFAPPGFDSSDDAVFEFKFIIRDEGVLDMISTKLTAPDGTTPIAAIVDRGILNRQEVVTTQ